MHIYFIQFYSLDIKIIFPILKLILPWCCTSNLYIMQKVCLTIELCVTKHQCSSF